MEAMLESLCYREFGDVIFTDYLSHRRKEKPLKITKGIGSKDFDDEGRLIIAEVNHSELP